MTLPFIAADALHATANNTTEMTDDNATEKTVAQWRQDLAAQCPDLDKDTWWLLGTAGCHLCDVAAGLIQRLQTVAPITYQRLDIIRLTDDDMAAFATKIPVLLAPNARLNYPFSILDLQQLATQS
jgi:hypothetical protein